MGTVYYKKHASAFEYPSPSTHFLQFASTSSLFHHQKWIDNVRQNVADRSTFDNDMVPSTEALYYHWKRTCRVLSQANRNIMVLEPMTEHGWSIRRRSTSGHVGHRRK